MNKVSNPKDLTDIIQLFISIASVIYLCLHISQSHTRPVITFVITLFVLYFLLKVPHYISFFLALLVSYISFDIYYIPQIESFLSRRNKKDHEHFSNDEEEDDDSGNDSKPSFDISSTVADALKNLTPNQIESMAAETKDLVHSQKQLVETLTQLTPIVKTGMDLMQSFGGGKQKQGGNVIDMFQQIKSKEQTALPQSVKSIPESVKTKPPMRKKATAHS
jgi:hypothetical protein